MRKPSTSPGSGCPHPDMARSSIDLPTLITDNCKFMSGRRVTITFITTRDTDGNLTLHAISTSRKHREVLLSAPGKTLDDAFAALHDKSAMELHHHVTAHGFGFSVQEGSQGKPDREQDGFVLTDDVARNPTGGCHRRRGQSEESESDDASSDHDDDDAESVASLAPARRTRFRYHDSTTRGRTRHQRPRTLLIPPPWSPSPSPSPSPPPPPPPAPPLGSSVVSSSRSYTLPRHARSPRRRLSESPPPPPPPPISEPMPVLLKVYRPESTTALTSAVVRIAPSLKELEREAISLALKKTAAANGAAAAEGQTSPGGIEIACVSFRPGDGRGGSYEVGEDFGDDISDLFASCGNGMPSFTVGIQFTDTSITNEPDPDLGLS